MVYPVISLLGGLGGFQDKVIVVLALSFCVTLNSSGSDGSVNEMYIKYYNAKKHFHKL